MPLLVTITGTVAAAAPAATAELEAAVPVTTDAIAALPSTANGIALGLHWTSTGAVAPVTAGKSRGIFPLT